MFPPITHFTVLMAKCQLITLLNILPLSVSYHQRTKKIAVNVMVSPVASVIQYMEVLVTSTKLKQTSN